MIKGSPVDPNADFLRGGQQEVLQAAIDAGDITIVGEAYTDDWQPANAQKNMEQILTETDNGVDAVVASNDGTAGGVVAALTAQGMAGIPVSGQDGDMAADARTTRIKVPANKLSDREREAILEAIASESFQLHNPPIVESCPCSPSPIR